MSRSRRDCADPGYRRDLDVDAMVRTLDERDVRSVHAFGAHGWAWRGLGWQRGQR